LLAAELEVLISRAPEQWHLLQPNWPTDRDPEAGDSVDDLPDSVSGGSADGDG
jgi:hypothetical protein